MVGFSSVLLTELFAGCAIEARGVLYRMSEGHGAEESFGCRKNTSAWDRQGLPRLEIMNRQYRVGLVGRDSFRE